MATITKIVIGSTERGVLYKDQQIVAILNPGTYRYVSIMSNYTVELFDIVKNPQLTGAAAQYFLQKSNEKFDSYFVKIVSGAREVVVVSLNAKAYVIMEPSEERIFWRGMYDVTTARYDISDNYEVSRETLRDLSLVANQRQVLVAKVPEQSMGILLESGVIIRELAPGNYGFWRAQRDISVVTLDTRLTALEISGQEMLTKDKVSLRVNLSISYRLINGVIAMKALGDIQGEIYRTAQLALRQAIGEKTLDELLESKEALNKGLAQEISTSMENFGIEVSRVGVKDIILPGEMRTLFNQVVEAEKAAQAQNIRRREEVAATRSLLNTAKMMENNPLLLRLKELEAVERISDKVEKLTVYDGLKGVMKGLVSLGE